MLYRLLYRNFRLLHRLSQWLRDRLTPGGSLIFGGIVAAGIFGIDTQQTLAFQILALTASLMLVAMLGSLTFRTRFRLQRRLPACATAGLPLRYRVRVENPGPRPQQDLLLIDELEAVFPDYAEFRNSRDPQDARRNWVDRLIGYPRLITLIRHRRGGSIPVRQVPDIPPYDRTDLDMEFTPVRRGYLRFAGLRLARPDPLGLFRGMRGFAARESLLVLPRTYRIPRLQLAGGRQYQQGGVTLVSHIGDSQEFLSLRDYQPGDPLRAIHWRSYARRGKPIVKEFQDEYFVRQGLVLDTFLDDGPDEAFEEAVSVTASFQLALEQQDNLTDLILVEDVARRLTSGRGLDSTGHMLEILACVRPCRDRPFAELGDLLLQHRRDLSALILVLLRWDTRRRELVRRLEAAGIPAAVFVIDAADADAVPEPAGGAGQPWHFVTLTAGRVQQDLDAVDWNRLQR